MSGALAGVDSAFLLDADPGVPAAVDVLPDAFFLPRKKVLIQGILWNATSGGANEEVK
jgi:hypothetical protein